MKEMQYTKRLVEIDETIDFKTTALKFELKFLKEELQDQYTYNQHQNSRAVKGTINIEKFLETDILKEKKMEKEELSKMVAEYNQLVELFRDQKVQSKFSGSILSQMQDFDR